MGRGDRGSSWKAPPAPCPFQKSEDELPFQEVFSRLRALLGCAASLIPSHLMGSFAISYRPARLQ